jgi:hypothetical protein
MSSPCANARHHVYQAQTIMKTLDKLQLSRAVVPLLKGVVYRDDALEAWRAVLAIQPQVADYVRYSASG